MTKTLDHTINKKRVYKVSCKGCSVLVINNHICHERGCPYAYIDQVRECRECGNNFTPENNNQLFCSDQCYAIYNGMPWCYENESEGN